MIISHRDPNPTRSKQVAIASEKARGWFEALIEGCDAEEANRRARAAVEVASEHCRNHNPHAEVGRHGKLAGRAALAAELIAKDSPKAVAEIKWRKVAA